MYPKGRGIRPGTGCLKLTARKTTTLWCFCLPFTLVIYLFRGGYVNTGSVFVKITGLKLDTMDRFVGRQ